MAKKPCVPEMSCTSNAASATPSMVRAWWRRNESGSVGWVIDSGALLGYGCRLRRCSVPQEWPPGSRRWPPRPIALRPRAIRPQCRRARPALFPHMAANGKPRALFAPQRDLVLLDQLADVLESHRRLIDSDTVMPRHAVEQVGGSHAARSG